MEGWWRIACIVLVVIDSNRSAAHGNHLRGQSCAPPRARDVDTVPRPLTVSSRIVRSPIVVRSWTGPTLTNEPDPVPRQHLRQLLMVHEHPRFSGFHLAHPTIEHRIDVLAGQAGYVGQPVDVAMLRMNRPRKSSSGGVVSRVNRIARRTNPGAAVPAKVE